MTRINRAPQLQEHEALWPQSRDQGSGGFSQTCACSSGFNALQLTLSVSAPPVPSQVRGPLLSQTMPLQPGSRGVASSVSRAGVASPTPAERQPAVMAYYNIRDLIGHWVAPRSARGKMCPHACCRGYRVHPGNYPVILPDRLLRRASDFDLADHYDKGTRGHTAADRRAELQIIHEMERRDRAAEEARNYFLDHPRPTAAYFRGQDTRATGRYTERKRQARRPPSYRTVKVGKSHTVHVAVVSKRDRAGQRPVGR